MQKRCGVVVAMERITENGSENSMFVRVSGGGIAQSRAGKLHNALATIKEIEEFGVTRHWFDFSKREGADWKAVSRRVRKAIRGFFGKGVRIFEREIPYYPISEGLVIGEPPVRMTELEEIRGAMRGCALTEEEREALGFSDAEYWAGLTE